MPSTLTCILRPFCILVLLLLIRWFPVVLALLHSDPVNIAANRRTLSVELPHMNRKTSFCHWYFHLWLVLIRPSVNFLLSGALQVLRQLFIIPIIVIVITIIIIIIITTIRVVFAIPVASSKSERVFSVAGNTVTQKRV